MTSEDSRYEAVRSRDARFDGVFFFAVATTGIYCRPSCPAIAPKRENVRFFPTAAAAQGAGFRACRRCRPDAVPGSADWNVRADVVGRAVRLIGDGVVDREGVSGLAARLGYSARQVQRQLTAELGAGPIALARAQRGHTARVLLQTTSMQAAEVAFAAGFASVRQFNETMREIYAATPTQLRAARGGRGERGGRGGLGGGAGAGLGGSGLGGAGVAGTGGGGTGAGGTGGVAGRGDRGGRGDGSGGLPGGVPLRLAYRGAYDRGQVFDFLAAHAVPGVEEVVGAPGRRSYRRGLRLPHGVGVVEVAERAGAGGWLECRLHLADLRDLTTATQRARRLFDLDADPYAVAERLGADPRLAPLVAARPGLRAPGAADAEEVAVVAVLGGAAPGVATADGIAAARGWAGAVASAYGEAAPFAGGALRVFPGPEVLADAELERFGVPSPRAAAVRALSAALVAGELRLDPGVDRDDAERVLVSVVGVDPGVARVIRMRALGDPDVALRADADAVAWRPWRSYAAHHLA